MTPEKAPKTILTLSADITVDRRNPRSQYRDLRGAGWNRWNEIEKLPATLDGEKLTESEKRALWGDR